MLFFYGVVQHCAKCCFGANIMFYFFKRLFVFQFAYCFKEMTLRTRFHETYLFQMTTKKGGGNQACTHSCVTGQQICYIISKRYFLFTTKVARLTRNVVKGVFAFVALRNNSSLSCRQCSGATIPGRKYSINHNVSV